MAKRWMLAVHDLNGNRLCSLYDSRVQQDGAAYDIKVTKEIGGWKEVSFNLSKAIRTKVPNFRCDFIKNEQQVWLTEDDETDIYCIKAPAALHDKSKIQFTVSCNHISEELKTKNLYKYFDDENGIGTCEELISRAIRGSGWHLVECDKFYESDGKTEKVRSYSCDSKTGAYNMITGICELFNARPVFHGHNRTIEIRAITNTEGWMEILFGKNSDKIKRTPDSSNIVTRLQVEGEYGDFGYVGIDDVNPTGLPFILNFDYFKEIGAFTNEHQAIADKYLLDYKAASDALQNATSETLKKQAELNNLIGNPGYAYYTIANGGIDWANAITGGGIDEEDVAIKQGDMITAVNADGSYVTKEYSDLDSFSGNMCLIKFVPVITGMIAAFEDKIEASQQSIESQLEKVNKFLRVNGYAETTVDGLKRAYGTDDLSIVNAEDFDLSNIGEAYQQKTVREYAASIGMEEKSIAENTLGANEKMLQAVNLIVELDQERITIEEEEINQETIEDNFCIAMGSMLRDGYWSDLNYTVGQEQSLYNDALEISKKLAFPTATYDIDTKNLSVKDEYAGEVFKLAQAVRMYDKDLTVNDHGIISKTIECPDKPTADKAEVKTDILDIGTKSFASILERVTTLAEEVRRNRGIYKRAAAISKDGKIQSNVLEGAIDVMKTQLLSSASNWRTDENGNIIFTSLDNRCAMMLCGGGFMIANSKKDNGEWNWRTFGTGDGFAADLIVTGFLNAERIAAGSITVNHLASDVGEGLDLSSNKSIELKVTSIVQGEISKVADVMHVSANEPLDPVEDMVWLDTSVDPNILKHWNGEEWEIVGEAADLVDRITNVELRLDGQDGTITALAEEVSALDESVKQAQLQLEPSKIVATVTDSQRYKNDIAGATMTADKFETFVENSDSISKISQKADIIEFVVKNDSTGTNVKFTDAAIDAMSEEINLHANDEFNVTVGNLETSIKANQDGIETNAQNIKTNADNIEANAKKIAMQADEITLAGGNITLIAKRVEKVEESSATIFRQDEFPTSYELVKPNDLLVQPSTGKQYQAIALEDINFSFTLGDDGALYYVIDDPEHKYSLEMQGFDLYERGFMVPVAEDGTIGIPYVWVLVQDLELQKELQDQAEQIQGAIDSIKDLQIQADGNITIWYYPHVPTANNTPASEWTTEDMKEFHVDDLFYVDDNASAYYGYCYRWRKINGTYQWVELRDADISKALGAAEDAQHTADGKCRVFVGTSIPQPPYDRGDMWTQGSTGDILYCATARASGSGVQSDWVKASKYVDEALVNTKINTTVAKVDVEYYLSTSSTQLSGGSWSTTAPQWVDGRYMWSRTTTTLKDGSTSSSNVTCITGAKGSTGASGVGVSGVKEQYCLSTSKTTAPSSGWQDTVPTWTAGSYMWTRSVIAYTNGTTSTTTPYCDSTWELAEEKSIYESISPPTVVPVIGKLWMDLSRTPPLLRRWTGVGSDPSNMSNWEVVIDTATLNTAQILLEEQHRLLKEKQDDMATYLTLDTERNMVVIGKENHTSEVLIDNTGMQVAVGNRTFSKFEASLVRFGNMEIRKPTTAGGLMLDAISSTSGVSM